MSGSSVKTQRLGIVAAAIEHDLRAAAGSARSLGFAALQLDIRLGELDLTRLSQSGRREVRSILRSRDLDLAGLRFDLGANGLAAGADIDAALDGIEKVLQAAAGLECSLVCIDVGPLPAPPAAVKPQSPISPEIAGDILVPAARREKAQNIGAKVDPEFAASVDGALAELGRRADRHGIILALRSDLAGFAALERALKVAACPWFGIDLDPVAILRDDWDRDEIFSRLGEAIRHVRGRDALLGADRRTKPAAVGHGSVEWERMLNDLKAAGYDGWITLDPMELPNRSAAAASGAAALGRLIQ
ncbi:MAG: TIM barrel protein [Tepidisphaeraceae bacterium]